MSEQKPPGAAGPPHHWLAKTLVTLIPLLLGALVTIAWQNTQALGTQARDQELMRRDIDRVVAEMEPRGSLMLRFDRTDRELAHLRELVEQRLIACQQPGPGK